MAISGTNNNYLFNSSSYNNNLAGLTNSLFGGGSSLLGDYAMIKSGTYKKLLTAYYKTEKAGSSSSDSDSTATASKRYDRFAEKKEMAAAATQSATVSKQYTTIRDEAGDLRTSAYALNSSSLYAEKTGEDGKASYDREEIRKAVKSFVTDYNNLLTASSNMNGTSMSKGVYNGVTALMKETKTNEAALNAIGITIGSDNKLTLDTEKLDSAEVGSISSLFKGSNSYGSSVSTKASDIAREANTSAFSATKVSSSYTSSGYSSVTGSITNILNQLL